MKSVSYESIEVSYSHVCYVISLIVVWLSSIGITHVYVLSPVLAKAECLVNGPMGLKASL